MRTPCKNVVVLVVAASALALSPQSGAQQNQNGSASAGQSSAQQPAPAAATPSGPVTGAFMGFLSNVEEGRSVLQYGFTASESADSNPFGVPGSSSVLGMTSVSGHLSIDKIGARSEFTAQVTGGALLYDTMSSDDAGLAGVSLGESLQFRHWTLLLSDQFFYLPQTPFGFSGGLFGGLGIGGLGGLTTPNPFNTETNSILSLNNQEIANTAMAQANFTTSARTTWTLSGGYTLTQYVHSGELPASGFMAGAGYSYELSQRDSIGINFSAALSDYGFSTNSLSSYTETLNYGHRFSSRLAIQLAGGGNEYNYATSSTGNRSFVTTYTASGAVNYLLGKSSLQLSAVHETFGGGGFLYGGVETFVQGSASRQITRFWQLNGGVGYGETTGLAGTLTAGAKYQSAFATVNLARQFSPNVSLYFQGEASHQTVSGLTCAPSIPCATPFTSYLASVGVNWNFRQIPLQ
jgi:hypothetical protein